MPDSHYHQLLHAAASMLAPFVAVAALAACASPPQTITDPAFDRDRLGRIAVFAPRFPPAVKPNESSVGYTATATGIGGFGACLSGAATAGPPALVFCATLAPAAALVGATMAAGAAPPAEAIARTNERINESIAASEFQARLRGQTAAAAAQSGYPVTEVADTGPTEVGKDWDYRAFATRGFDTVLEVGITDITSRTRPDGRITLLISARARVIDLHADRTLLRAQYRYLSGARTVDQWLRLEASAIRDALQDANRALSDHMLDETLRLMPIADMLPAREEYPLRHVRFRGLRPLSPRKTVDTPHPFLHWEAFPRSEDRARDTLGVLAHIRDVRYDLRLAAENDFGLVERVDGLSVPEYRVPRALEPEAAYRWTVRARFVLDGRERVTPWGRPTAGFGCSDETLLPVNEPNQCSYRFDTGRWLGATNKGATP